MTIRMLQAWNGYPQQAIVTTLSFAEEARLVGLGLATVDLDGIQDDMTARTTRLAGELAAVGIPSYTGQVASRCMLPTTGGSANKQLMSRSRHVAHDAIGALQLAYANWYITVGGVETNSGSANTFRASIEYPIGTITRVYFSGSEDGVIDDGGTLVSDVLSITIPRGAVFFVRTWQNCPGGVLFSNRVGLNTVSGGPTASGEWWTYGVTVTDYTGVATNVNNQGQGNFFAPAAIIAKTSRPSFLILGDSRCVPQNNQDTVCNEVGAIGEQERTLAKSYGTINVAAGGESFTHALAGFTKRAAFTQYCSHVIISLGINDFTAGRTSTQALGDLASLLAGKFPGKKAFAATVAPKSSSTDSWATTTNQTPDAASNTNRVAYNNALRSGQHTAGIVGYVEVADAVESARDSGVWKAPGYTGDGLHELTVGFKAVEDSLPYSKFAV